MTRVKKLLSSRDLWFPLLIMVPAAWALLPGGLPNTADGPVHFIRSVEMVHAWEDGVLIPRWSRNLGYGYGLPLFVYAPASPYYLSAAFQVLGLPLEVAFKIMMLAGIMIGGYGAYRLSRVLLGVWPGVAGTAAFVYAPIMLREIFIQGNSPQYLAWSMAPWAAWAVIQLYRPDRSPYEQRNNTRRARYSIILALFLLGTLLSHNPTALIMMGMVSGLALVLVAFTRNLRALIAAAMGSAAGLALGAWFWAPALLEGKYVQIHRIVASDFRLRFIALNELLALSPRLDSGAINPFFPFTLGAVQVWIGFFGALAFLLILGRQLWVRFTAHGTADPQQLDREQSAQHSEQQATVQTTFATERGGARPVLMGTGVFFILFTAFCTFMATRWSEPVWAVLPFVDLFEWPFRWHGFTAVGLSWLCAFAVFAVAAVAPRWTYLAGSVCILLLVGSALVNLYPQKLLPGTRRATPRDVVRYEAKSSAVGTTSLGEFIPIWVDGTFDTSPLVEDYLAERPINRLPNPMPTGASGTPSEASVHRQQFEVSLPASATLTLDVLYFPGWRADVNGTPVEIRPHPGSGLMDIDLPAGDHTLTLTFGSTGLRGAAEAVSAISWLGLLLTAGIMWVHARKRKLIEGKLEDGGKAKTPVRTSALVLTVLMATILAVQLVAGDLFKLQSQPDQALAASRTLRADFEEKIRLLGVDSPPAVVQPGDVVTVVAYWRALQALETDHAVFLHLDDRVTGETIATIDQTHPSDIPTSGWATGLHVRNPLSLTVPEDADPIRYSLRLGISDHETGDLLSLRATADGEEIESGVFEVAQVWVDSHEQPRSPGSPRARFGDEIELLGMGYDDDTQELVLIWRSDTPTAQDYSVFVHLLDDAGNLLGQVDGTPYQNRYPTSAWRPGQVIEDRRGLSEAVDDLRAIDGVAIGVYDPTSGVRLPALDADGNALVDSALTVSSDELRGLAGE